MKNKTADKPAHKAQPNQLHIPFTEKLKSIPDFFGIRTNETPSYKVIEKDGDFERRLYAKQLRAKVTIKGQDFNSFREAAFEKLAEYIFGGNVTNTDMAMTTPTIEKHEEIAMTSPVIQKAEGDEAWSMSFILPSKYNLQNLPVPKNSEIQIETLEPYEVAAVVYSGDNTLAKMKENQIRLATWIAGRPGYKRAGDFFSAQYDAPFAISFLKKNEVQIKIAKSH